MLAFNDVTITYKKEEKYHIRNDFGMIFFTNSENKKNPEIFQDFKYYFDDFRDLIPIS